MEDWKSIVLGTSGGAGALIIVGRFVVPLLKKMFDNMAIRLDAEGGAIVKTQEDRDYWHKAYGELSVEMKEIRDLYVEMSSNYKVLEYKFDQSEMRHTECEERYREIAGRLEQANQRIHQLERSA